MIRIFSYIIDSSNIEQTILSFLKEKQYPHHVLVNLKSAPDCVLLNDTPVFLKTKLTPGDTLRIVLKETAGSEKIVPISLPFPIIYEDEDLLVVNKPAHMPIHPSLNHYENTLANAAAFYFSTKESPCTFRCINRLDRDTTGLTILAKHRLSASILSMQMTQRQIQRTYLAIVTGRIPSSGRITAPIGRVNDSTIERCVDFTTGESACTNYQRIVYTEKQNGLSLVSLQLETGRTHQIRVHMKYINHPIIGDFLYNPDFSAIQRQALHASHLSFTHPITGKRMEFDAPLPQDMAALFPEY